MRNFAFKILEKLNYILRSVKIVDPRSKYNGQKNDILIESGIISQISKKINYKKHYIEIKIKNLHVSPGFLDINSRIGEPGFEHKEDAKSGSNAAKKGGYTGIVYMPSTNPPIQNASDINFVKKIFEKNIVDVFPSGCITKNMQGTEITEMYNMKNAGAVTFTDDLNSIENPMIMSIALEYAKEFKMPIIVIPFVKKLCENGLIHEGKTSTLLGLNGIPNIAEEIRISRDIELAKYNKGRLHFSAISTQKSFELIKKAKEEKINISADIAAYQLILNDEMLSGFDTNIKVFPPIREKKIQKELVKNIKNGNIDAISSNHKPVEIEKKKCSFNNADFGMIGLETTFAIANTVLKNKVELEKIISLLSISPRKILNIKCPKIEETNKANITLYDPEKKWTFEYNDIKSKSKNTPFKKYEFTGKTLGIFNKGQIFLDD